MLDTPTEPWPPTDYVQEAARRIHRLSVLRRNPIHWRGAKEYYRTHPVEFSSHWCVTYDPRNAVADRKTPPTIPFVPFKRQRELFEFVYACLNGSQSGLVEKTRDMGATWCCAIISVHLWLFWPGASISWGSRKAMLVDQLGNPDSIFEKIRILLRRLPPELLPPGFSLKEHMSQMRILNPETGATIIGEAGDDIGRGGRSLIVFKDESAHYEHPESIEAALSDNALTQIDISSVNGLGNVFHRKRENGVDWSPGEAVVAGRTNVFVMDWRHHPAKTQAWYDERRAKAESDGLLRVFAQEIDRDYSAAVAGVIIPAPWVRACIDAHKILKLKGDGRWCAALDVADNLTDGDVNALAKRQGIVLKALESWGERDTGVTARRAVDACRNIGAVYLQYDSVGVGSGIKAEANRLADEKLLPKGVRLIPWNAGAGPQDPEKHVIPGDRDSPLNQDFYANLKAQGWWELRRRCELTYRAVQEISEGHLDEQEFTWVEDDLISFPSDLPLLWQLVKELSQPTMTQSSRMKLLIEKQPEGTRSPNLADAVMMCYWPMKVSGPLEISEETMRKMRALTPRR